MNKTEQTSLVLLCCVVLEDIAGPLSSTNLPLQDSEARKLYNYTKNPLFKKYLLHSTRNYVPEVSQISISMWRCWGRGCVCTKLMVFWF